MSSLLQKKIREREEVIFYNSPIINQEAEDNYRERYGKDPTPEELGKYISSGEEARDFFEKRKKILV